MTKKIVFEEPTTVQRSGTRASQMRAYVNELSKSPDRWAIYARNVKSPTYFYQIAKEFPNLRIATRMNADRKTMRVYFMVLSKPNATTKRVVPTKTSKTATKSVKTSKTATKSIKSR